MNSYFPILLLQNACRFSVYFVHMPVTDGINPYQDYYLIIPVHNVYTDNPDIITKYKNINTCITTSTSSTKVCYLSTYSLIITIIHQPHNLELP